ncbi:hypothetical protein RAC92_20585 [Agrobacterium sp. CR_3]|uniref:hypothetical protein n=1 Tax=unclassified Agrobacterium TaxID=2632611 RepID=UPI0035C0C440
MQSTVITSVFLLSISASTAAADRVASREEFRGHWSRDCGNDQTCHLDIDDMKSRTVMRITFSIEGKGATCTWWVDAVYDKGLGGPVAQDPYSNYYFYLTRQEDGRLYSSGTMLPTCGSQPTDQYFTSDAQTSVDNREVFDHNGSAVIVSPSKGTIIYRDPKMSIAGTVKPGALLFKANAPWNPYDDNTVIRGTAYVFKEGCDPAQYSVSGHQQGWHTLVLKGAAPVREKNGCKIVDYKMNNNSTLKFVSRGD